MSSIAARKRAKRTRNIADRAKAKSAPEMRSKIDEITKRNETVTTKQDAPFAEKRKVSRVTPLQRLLKAETLSKPQYEAGVKLASDKFKHDRPPRTTSNYEPEVIHGHDNSDPIDAIEAHARYRFVMNRVEHDEWQVVRHVVIDEFSCESYRGCRTAVARTRLRTGLDQMIGAYREYNAQMAED